MGKIFTRPQPKKVLPFSGERLTTALTGQTEIEHLHRYFLARTMCQGQDALDVASGEGYGAALLAQVARTVVGVEIAPEAVEHAKSAYTQPNLQFLQSDARTLPLLDASVDLVVSFETIEHFDEHDQFLAEIRRVLRAGGRLLISTPDRDNYSQVGTPANPFHVLEMTRAEFLELLRRHFAYVACWEQRPLIGSVMLLAASGTNSVPAPLCFERRGDHFEESTHLARPQYMVAVASDRPVEVLPDTVYIETSQLEVYQQEIGSKAARAEAAHAQALEEAIAQKDAHARALEEAIAQNDAHARALEEAIAQKDAHARALEEAIAHKDAHARALEEAIAQKDAHARALEEAIAQGYPPAPWKKAIAQKDAHARALEEAIAQKDAHAYAPWKRPSRKRMPTLAPSRRPSRRRTPTSAPSKRPSRRRMPTARTPWKRPSRKRIAHARALEEAIAQKDAHARALEEAIAQKDAHARALEEAIAQKDAHARAPWKTKFNKRAHKSSRFWRKRESRTMSSTTKFDKLNWTCSKYAKKTVRYSLSYSGPMTIIFANSQVLSEQNTRIGYQTN